MSNIRSSVLKLVGTLGLATGLFAAAGCDSVDAAFDCQTVCERYRDCFNKDYDVGKCRSDCRTASANDSTVRAKADACEACIGPMSCIGSAVSCSQDCSVIVP